MVSPPSRVTIYINGKEVEASVKQIRAEMNRLVNEQNRMVIGSDEYISHAKKIKELRQYLKEHAQNIGSAASAWTEMYNKVLQFGTGIGGIAVQAGLATGQILGFASAFDQDMQKVEMSATAFQKLIQKVISKPAEFAKIVGMELGKFKQLIETDMNEALKKVLKGFSGAGGFDKLLPIFQDLGLDGARAAAISSMANSLDKVEAAQQVANRAMLEGVSCYEEFSIKNNNMQASLEKARKKFQDTRLELGQKLYPILLKLTKTSTAGIKALSSATTPFR